MTPLRPEHRIFAFTVFALALAVPCARVQAMAEPAPGIPSAIPVYDVMSVKLNKSLSGSTDIDVDDGRFTATNVSLKNLLSQAYDIKQNLIFGIPGPLDSDRFDVEAKVVDPDPEAIKKMNREQRRAMLLPLLIDRFQLKTHTEPKKLPIYELVVVKGGPKCKLSADQKDTSGGDMSTNGSRAQVKISGQKVPMSAFAKALSTRVDRTVIDKTGLTGIFDLDLIWSNDNNPDSGAEQLPSVFTAIQDQLGLKLQPARGPVDTLIVDHAAMPSGN